MSDLNEYTDRVSIGRRASERVSFFLWVALEREGYGVGFNYESAKWKHKRESILRRDKYKCQECRRYGKNTEAITVHHIKHVDEYPELAYENDNLISLCNGCHNKMHPEKGKKHYRY